MPTFNKRSRDNKGAGMVKIETDAPPDEKAKNTAIGKWVVGGIGAVVVAGGLSAAFLMSGGNDNQTHKSVENNRHGPAQTQQTVPTAPKIQIPQVPTTPAQPVVKVQSAYEKVQQKLNAIYNRSDCYDLAVAHVDSNGREVHEGSDFSYFTCMQSLDDSAGGISMLLTEGDWAGTRIGFFPRENNGRGQVFVQKYAEERLGADNQTKEFYALPSARRTLVQSDMHGARNGHAIEISQFGDQFDKRAGNGQKTITMFSVKGEPLKGRFEIELVNGDVFKIDLNTGDFYVNSLFLNCPNYKMGKGQAEHCPRDNYAPVIGHIPGIGN